MKAFKPTPSGTSICEINSHAINALPRFLEAKLNPNGQLWTIAHLIGCAISESGHLLTPTLVTASFAVVGGFGAVKLADTVD